MLLHSDSYRTFLSDELARRMRSNPRYSQRAFARQLGLSPGELSEILRGKRRLSLSSAVRIAQALGLNPEETRHLGYLVQVEKSRELGASSVFDRPEDSAAKRQLTMDMFNIVSEWYCFAIINLAECDGFRWNCDYIARRLGLSALQARIALERLERVGLVERKKGRLQAAKEFVFSPDGVPSEAIRSYHRQILSKAIVALESQKLEEREIRGTTFAVDPDQLPAIKKELSEFLEKFARKYSKNRRREVYQLELAFIRLTHGGSEDVKADR